METLPSDLLIEIAEATPKPDVTLCRIRRLSKRTHDLITPLRLTIVVAKQLQARSNYLPPHDADILRLILEDCAKKVQAQREAEVDGKPLLALALGSVALSQYLLKTLKPQGPYHDVNWGPREVPQYINQAYDPMPLPYPTPAAPRPAVAATRPPVPSKAPVKPPVPSKAAVPSVSLSRPAVVSPTAAAPAPAPGWRKWFIGKRPEPPS